MKGDRYMQAPSIESGESGIVSMGIQNSNYLTIAVSYVGEKEYRVCSCSLWYNPENNFGGILCHSTSWGSAT
jgi:hypothetical protein